VYLRSADAVCMTHLTTSQPFALKTMLAAACLVAPLALSACGGSGSDSAYAPPITVQAGKLPDRLALVDLAGAATVSPDSRSICQLYRLLVTGSGPAGNANFDLTDPAAVRAEFESEQTLMLQVAQIDSPIKADVRVYADTITSQIATLKANGWSMLDPKVLGAYQDPKWMASVGRIQVWGAAECGVVNAESGLLDKLTALMMGGGGKAPSAEPTVSK
jgi:hypothetical protein